MKHNKVSSGIFGDKCILVPSFCLFRLLSETRAQLPWAAALLHPPALPREVSQPATESCLWMWQKGCSTCWAALFRENSVPGKKERQTLVPLWLTVRGAGADQTTCEALKIYQGACKAWCKAHRWLPILSLLKWFCCSVYMQKLLSLSLLHSWTWKRIATAMLALAVVQKHMAIKGGWTRWPSALAEVQWAHSQLQMLTPVLTRETRWVSKISSWLCRMQVTITVVFQTNKCH